MTGNRYRFRYTDVGELPELESCTKPYRKWARVPHGCSYSEDIRCRVGKGRTSHPPAYTLRHRHRRYITFIPVNFIIWLIDQLDTEMPRVSKFAKVIWDDTNNGCGDRRYDAVAWRDHFTEKHHDYRKVLIGELIYCYSVYAQTLIK